MRNAPLARLQSANVSYREFSDLTYTTRSDLPTVHAWRTIKAFAAYKCPFCGGPHKNGDPSLADDGNRTRLTGCYDEFRIRPGTEVNLDVQRGAPPRWVNVYAENEERFSELHKAYVLIAEGRLFSKEQARESPLDEWDSFFAPDRHDVILGLRAMERVGALDTAWRLRDELAATRLLRFQRGAPPEWFWPAGRKVRAQLLGAIASAYRMEHLA